MPLISRPAGSLGPESADAFDISPDGQVVYFRTIRSDLVAGDDNGIDDVFAWRASDDSIERITVDGAGEDFSVPAVAGWASSDGSRFVWLARDYRPSSLGAASVWARDLETQTTWRVDSSALDTGGMYVGGVSADGRWLAVYSDDPQFFDAEAGVPDGPVAYALGLP